MSPATAAIPEKLFFKIGEVCEIAGVQAHVLRYWETEFPMLAPQKNRAGQRTYRRRDVEMALRIKELLYEEQYTIAGAKKKLANDLRAPVRDKIISADAESPRQPTNPPRSLRSHASPATRPDSTTKSSADSGPGVIQSGALQQIAAELREILDLLESSDTDSKPSRR